MLQQLDSKSALYASFVYFIKVTRPHDAAGPESNVKANERPLNINCEPMKHEDGLHADTVVPSPNLSKRFLIASFSVFLKTR